MGSIVRPMYLKANLKRLMESKGLKASQLARLSGVPAQRLCDWLAGAQVRNLDQLKKVCEILEVTLDAILFSEDSASGHSNKSKANDFLEEQIFVIKVKRLKE